MPLHYARLAEAPGAEPALPLPVPSLLFQPEKIKATAERFGVAGRYTVADCALMMSALAREQQYNSLAHFAGM